jgi:hypothetical protein
MLPRAQGRSAIFSKTVLEKVEDRIEIPKKTLGRLSGVTLPNDSSQGVDRFCGIGV